MSSGVIAYSKKRLSSSSFVKKSKNHPPQMSAVVSFPLDFQLKLILSVIIIISIIFFIIIIIFFMKAVNDNLFPLNT